MKWSRSIVQYSQLGGYALRSLDRLGYAVFEQAENLSAPSASHGFVTAEVLFGTDATAVASEAMGNQAGSLSIDASQDLRRKV